MLLQARVDGEVVSKFFFYLLLYLFNICSVIDSYFKC
jgi:hypothetical protein